MMDLEKKFQMILPLVDTVSTICANEYSSYSEMLETLGNAKNHFFDTGEILPCVRAEVAQSWKRCKELGLPEAMEYVDGDDLKKLLKQNAYLLNIASPVISYVYESLTSASCLCTIYLTDSDGVILECFRNEALDEVADMMGLRVGAKWQEKFVGTNSISLALEHNKEYQTYAPEHYILEHNFVNCISVLIHNNDNEVVGTITLSYFRDYYNDFLMAIILNATKLVENQLLNMRYMGIVDYTLNNASEGVLILDTKLHVIQANKKFIQLIKENQIKEGTLDIKMLFKDIDFDKIFQEGNLHTEINETFLSYKNIYLRVNVDIYRIDTYGTADGYVIICRDISDIITLSQQFVGSTTSFRFDTIVTQNPQMLSIIRQCKQVANNICPILLEGDSGTGKEVFAQSIHNASNRASKPFIAVNCAALPINLVESELFGYEKGSFTDGLATGKAGKFELANGGTIFLDEIGELPLDVQAKLLRVLDNYRITRIGGKAEKKLDIRLIAATNRDLYAQVQAKSFREDLYYRINVMNFKLPALEKRRDDIPLLIEFFINKLNIENRGISKQMSQSCIEALCRHKWKGNVRELQNIVTRSYYLCNDLIITEDHLPIGFLEDDPLPEQKNPLLTRCEMELELMQQALNNNNGNVTLAAKQIQMSRATFYRKMKEYNL